MIKVVYIVGLGHSGSTLLDLLLSGHPRIMGLGEIGSVLWNKTRSGEYTEHICSCKQLMNECEFWSQFKTTKGRDKIEEYRSVLHLTREFGKKVIVDSSKNLPPLECLKQLHDNKEIELKVIFLVKDKRGWAASMKKADKRWGKEEKASFHYWGIWYYRNNEIKKYLVRNNIQICCHI